MKISKFVKLVKNAGRCIVADVENSGIWLGNGYGFYRATNLPRMEGAEQVRTVLDVPEKAWEKVYLTEEWYGNAQNVMGMNLSDYEKEEKRAEKIRVVAAMDDVWAACCRCDDGELIFYRENLLSPIMDEVENSDYIMFTVRRMTSGQRYLAVHDGMNLLAAIMPMRVVSEEYLGRLAEFEAMCAEQLNRERAREKGATEAENQEDGEQLGMEDAEE